MPKALLHLIARHKAQDALTARLHEEVARLRAAKTSAIRAVNLMIAIDGDPLGARSDFVATIEVCGGSSDGVATFLDGVGDRLDDIVHADLSTALLGEEKRFMDGAAAPVRYQYLMRRNADYDRAAYLTHYRDFHSQFGPRTPGIVDYVQFYVDANASRRLAASTGLGVWGVDSVSELHLESVDAFIAAVTTSETPAQATADERRFVDRKQSIYFCSDVFWDDGAQ